MELFGLKIEKSASEEKKQTLSKQAERQKDYRAREAERRKENKMLIEWLQNEHPEVYGEWLAYRNRIRGDSNV